MLSTRSKYGSKNPKIRISVFLSLNSSMTPLEDSRSLNLLFLVSYKGPVPTSKVFRSLVVNVLVMLYFERGIFFLMTTEFTSHKPATPY